MTFYLEVTSKKGDKTDKTYKTVPVNECILPSDYFSVDGTIFKPTNKLCEKNGTHYWEIVAGVGRGPGCYNQLLILFPGISPPIPGTYFLQPDGATLTAGHAYVQVGVPTGIECSGVVWVISTTSGTLNVSNTYNGKIRVTFNNVDATWGSNHYQISGDITCH